jgi:cyclopropane fatty-acyl-phospholipid synthase-like methyltransferase
MMSSPNDVTAKVFDIVYEHLVSEKKTRRELDFVTSKLNRGDTILDVGCGTGRHMIPLLKMGYEVLGIDNSKEMRISPQTGIVSGGASVLGPFIHQ